MSKSEPGANWGMIIYMGLALLSWGTLVSACLMLARGTGMI
jgi:hypothetical protein